MNMKLKEHIEIFKQIRFPGKANIIRMIWHIASEHNEEIACEDFIQAVLPPRNR